MRTWMVILLILSCVDFTITFNNSFKFNLSWIVRLLTLILFCTNY